MEAKYAQEGWAWGGVEDMVVSAWGFLTKRGEVVGLCESLGCSWVCGGSWGLGVLWRMMIWLGVGRKMVGIWWWGSFFFFGVA
jgi:hypothetical protein